MGPLTRQPTTVLARQLAVSHHVGKLNENHTNRDATWGCCLEEVRLENGPQAPQTPSIERTQLTSVKIMLNHGNLGPCEPLDPQCRASSQVYPRYSSPSKEPSHYNVLLCVNVDAAF